MTDRPDLLPSRRATRPALPLLLGALLTAAAGGGCERAFLVAPSTSVLVLSASSTTVAVNGTVTITATVTTPDGGAVAEGTTVTFTATTGTFQVPDARVTNGRASAVYTAGGTAGSVTVTASSGSVSNTLTLRVGAQPARLDLSAATSGTSATISAAVFDAQGRSVPATTVTFTTSAGVLSSGTAVTDAYGRANVTLTGGVDAIVTASASGVTASLLVRYAFNNTLSVNLAMTPAAPVRGQNVVFVATALLPNGQSVPVERYEWTFSDGVVLTTTGNQTMRAFVAEGRYVASVRAWSVDGAVGLSTIEFFVD